MRRQPSRGSVPSLPEHAVGFLEESAGVRSATRLIMVGLLGLAGCVTLSLCAYVLFVPSPSAGIAATLAGALATLVIHGAVAVSKR
jgi:hypothetical protein